MTKANKSPELALNLLPVDLETTDNPWPLRMATVLVVAYRNGALSLTTDGLVIDNNSVPEAIVMMATGFVRRVDEEAIVARYYNGDRIIRDVAICLYSYLRTVEENEEPVDVDPQELLKFLETRIPRPIAIPCDDCGSLMFPTETKCERCGAEYEVEPDAPAKKPAKTTSKRPSKKATKTARKRPSKSRAGR